MWKPSQQTPGDSGKLLRFSLILAVVLMSLWFAVTLTTNPVQDSAGQTMLFDQEVPATENPPVGATSPVKPVRMQGIGQPARTSGESAADRSSGRLGTSGLVMAFILMTGLLGAGFWAYRKHNPGQSASQGVVRVKENVPIATGHQLTLIEINNEVWVLGISGTQMTLLHRYAVGEWSTTVPKSDVSSASQTGSSKITGHDAGSTGTHRVSNGSDFYMDLIRKNGFQLK